RMVNTMFHMTFCNGITDLFQSCVNSTNLNKDINTITILLNHTLYSTNLTFNTFQSIYNSLFFFISSWYDWLFIEIFFQLLHSFPPFIILFQLLRLISLIFLIQLVVVVKHLKQLIQNYMPLPRRQPMEQVNQLPQLESQSYYK